MIYSLVYACILKFMNSLYKTVHIDDKYVLIKVMLLKQVGLIFVRFLHGEKRSPFYMFPYNFNMIIFYNC